jgi:hypothetical protein
MTMAVLLLGAGGSSTHAHISLKETPVMQVHVAFGKVILRPRDDESAVNAIVDYPGGVQIDAHESSGTIVIRVDTGTAQASWGTLTVDYPSSMRVEAGNDAGSVCVVGAAQGAIRIKSRVPCGGALPADSPLGV